MSSLTSHKQQILENVSNAFAVTDDQLNFLIEGFNEEMKAGLAIDRTSAVTKTSELKMIPSYVTGK
jgi:hexokinase